MKTCPHCNEILMPLVINERISACQNRSCPHIFQLSRHGVIVDLPLTIYGRNDDETQTLADFLTTYSTL